MPQYAAMVLLVSAYLTIAGVVYLVTGHDYLGSPMELVAGGCMAYIGIYVRRAVKHADRAPADGTAEVLPHIGPTIWPFVFSIAAGVLAAGAIAAPWLLAVGGILAALAAVGWVLDIRHQGKAPASH